MTAEKRVVTVAVVGVIVNVISLTASVITLAHLQRTRRSMSLARSR